MSYNIEDVEIVEGSLTMAARDISEIVDKQGDDGLPEICFLHDHIKDANAALRAGNPGADIALNDLAWSGTWSGNSFEFLMKGVLTKTRGTAAIAVTWEDGAVTGLRVKDGKVKEVSAKKVLGE